jgi:hypothetical protein
MAEFVELDVVVYQSETHWIAQGLQFDITAQAAHPADLPKKFMLAMASEAMVAQELGEDPFANIPPAPPHFWELYKTARVTLVSDQVPALRVTGRPKTFQPPPLKMRMTEPEKIVA